MRKWWFTVLAVVTATYGMAAAVAQTSEPIKPIPLDMKLDARKVELGEKLFFDKRVSKDNSIACIQCQRTLVGNPPSRKCASENQA